MSIGRAIESGPNGGRRGPQPRPVADAAVYLLEGRQRRMFGRCEEGATLRTLRFATSSLRELRQALAARSAARVLPKVQVVEVPAAVSS
ncbi:MAG: hypothetical protein M3024_15535 [Candidatus Dormibacteraeota bacterium]|nr:hypothetical protein [Candidatus Dormibacteraeota bacterium]